MRSDCRSAPSTAAPFAGIQCFVHEPTAASVAAHAPADERLKKRAAVVSLCVAIVLLLVKFQAYRVTGSMAVLSDALESIVNVVAAAFAIAGLWFAGMPADRNHPYGHGKIEFFAAAFEGGLIAFAALLILWEAGHALLHGSVVRELDAGIVLTGAAGLGNGLLGLFLLRVGKKHRSLTLIADGQHVLSDFWTSVGLVAGLVLVRLTGIPWIDPLVAMVVAIVLLVTGAKLVRTAAGGLLDEQDPQLVERVVALLNGELGQGVIRVHHLRAIRAGRVPHISAHLVVPEHFRVDVAHDIAERVAASVGRQLGEGELDFHTDPCFRSYCKVCDIGDCPVRQQPFAGNKALSVEEAVTPDELMLH
jgi:cation diffusion facilitator family transporter